MERFLLICVIVLCSMARGFSQNCSAKDSAFIYDNLLCYNSVTKELYDIDEPYISDFHDSIPAMAEYYFRKAAFIESIPAWQRVVMVGYLPYQQKKECLKWIYHHLDKRRTKEVELFLWAVQYSDFGYGIPFSELGISQEEVKKFCRKCEYK